MGAMPLLPKLAPRMSLAYPTLPHASLPADGGMYLATPIDPLLVMLPLLERAREQQNVFQDIEQVLGWVAECALRVHTADECSLAGLAGWGLPAFVKSCTISK